MSGSLNLQVGDVVLMRGRGFAGAVVRFFTRGIGEGRTRVSHAGLIVEGGPIDRCILVEALHRVTRDGLWGRYGGSATDVAVYRPTDLGPEERVVLAKKAESYVGRRYGYMKILAHWLDWVLQGAYVFRRLADEDRYPICSWVVAQSFAAVGKSFGVEAGAATPDDIWDFVTARTDQYEPIVELGPLLVQPQNPA